MLVGHTIQKMNPLKLVAYGVQRIDLALAETIAERLGWSYEWAYEEIGADDMLGDHAYWCDKEQRGESHDHDVLYCILKGADGNMLESLGGIIDPDRNYGRVIDAELASEALAELNRMRVSGFVEPIVA